jgi:hypothetical protein
VDDLDKHRRIVDRVSGHTDALIQRLVAYIVRRLGGVGQGEWYDDKAVRALAVELAAQVRTVQETAANVTAQGLVYHLDVAGARVKSEPVRLSPAPRGVDPVDVWERPAKTYRRMRARGLDELEAAEQAFQRARAIAEDDVQLARRLAARDRMRKSGAVGYRRAVHPELARGGSCGLCVAAASRVYRVDDLMPIHTGCNCEVVPITKGNDPAKTINDAALDAYYATGVTGRDELKRFRFEVHQHGELGPRLTEAGQEFTGPGGVTVNAGRAKHRQQVRAEVARLEKLRDASVGDTGRKHFQAKIDALTAA